MIKSDRKEINLYWIICLFNSSGSPGLDPNPVISGADHAPDSLYPVCRILVGTAGWRLESTALSIFRSGGTAGIFWPLRRSGNALGTHRWIFVGICAQCLSIGMA